MSSKRPDRGIGNLVVAVYGVFALSATVRASYQLIRRYDEAPLAYWLSLFSALVYVVATIALARNKVVLAKYTLIFELAGVITIGLLSVLLPSLFAHPTVWSFFGMGYGFIPLALPIFGLWWISGRKS
ncbi:MAG: hypothetical protein RJA78_894 [Actinomycetota bacterium]|jgi:hypothetical protein